MADNINITEGSGKVVGADDISSVSYQRIKLIHGADGVNAGDVATGNPLPVVQTGTPGLPTGAATSALQTQPGVDIGDVTINNSTGGSAVNIQDGGNSITVDYATTGSGTATGALRVELPTNGTGTVGLNAGTNAIGKLAANSGVDIGDVDVTSVPADPFGVNADAASATGSISAKLRFIASTGIPITGTVTVGSHAVTNAGTFVVQENGAALTSLQLIDDVIFTDDTSTHATGTTKGAGIMAVATPTDAAVDANDIGMLAMTNSRALKNDITTIAGTAPTTAGFIDIKGADGNVFVRQATASNLNMTEASAASSLTSLQLIDDTVFTDDTSTHSTGTTKVLGIGAVAAPTDTAVNANDIGMPAMTTDRKLHVSIQDIAGTAAVTGSGTATGTLRVELPTNGTGVVGLNAGTALVGKVGIDQTTPGTTNNVSISASTGAGTSVVVKDDPSFGDGVTTGIASVAPRFYNGTNYDRARGDTTGQDVHAVPKTSGGWTTFHLVAAATTNATNLKASAGQVGGWYIYNSNAAARKVAFHNTAGTPTAGASIFFAIVIPPTSGANVEFTNGIPFSTGIAITTVTDLTDAGSTAVALNDLVMNIWYK